MAQNDNKISNVIGTHIPNWLLNQLKTRSSKGFQYNRDNENLQYLGNKTGWVRMVSSININSQNDIKYFQDLTGLTLTKPEDLAKNFILYGGVSKYNNQNNKTTYTLRQGFKETYSLLGEKEVQDFGYRPMPGLTRVVVETQGKLGSIRSATIDFKVWDVKQLDVMDALYFKLGYTMFLEWGNTFYYASDSDGLKASELFSLNPFEDRLTKEQITLRLGKNRKESEGNYDGMWGMVTNFSFSYNQEGGYDCVLKLVGVGSLADTTKINQPATLPDVLQQQIESLNSIYAQIQQQNEAKIKADQTSLEANQKTAEEKAALDKLQTDKQGKQSLFNSLKEKEQEEKGIKGGIAGDFTAENIEESFFRNHALPPSKLVSTKKTLDYDQRSQYDYIYEDLLYLTKPGIILQGNSGYSKDITNIVQSLNLDSNYVSTVILKGQSINSLVESGLTRNGSQFSKNVVYYSTTNKVNNSTYPEGYPYTLGIDLTFVDKDSKGNNITYGNTKATIATEFLKQLVKEKSQTSISLNSYSLRISKDNKFALFIRGDFSWGLNLSTTQTEFSTATGKDETKTTPSKAVLKLPFTIQIEDSSLIADIVLKAKQDQTSQYLDYRYQQQKLAKQNAGKLAAENTAPTSNTSTEQTKPAVQFQSSLEATLRTIQIYSLVKAIDASSKKIDLDRKVRQIPLTERDFANKLFSAGIFAPYIDAILDKTLKDSDIDQKNVKYGFNASILSNKNSSVPEVDYMELLKSYVLPYDINQDVNDGSRLAHPVYIPFGLLLFILNHTCTLYDRKKEQTDTSSSTKKTTPLFYIDYNPETNFCLSHPCHMSTNALTFMIPFQGKFDDYKKLFYENVLEGDNIKGTTENKNQTTPLFNPETEDTISGDIPRFKGSQSSIQSVDTYRGRIMNVLVNIDYVFDIIKQFFSQDETNSVFLKAFVEQLLSDMNKTLGNFNVFRLSYDDTANCLQIVDDQLVPGLDGEEMLPKNGDFDIPIFGKGSIARSLDLRTDLSAKISNTLAISANSDLQKKSASSVDGTPFGFINAEYEDRYISNRAEPVDISREKEILKLNQSDISSAISSALRFNKNVKDFYSTYNPSTENVGHAINYFIEKLTKNKLDGPTRAAAMIPVSVNFTLDGVSGFNMMQGFTISDKFLPYTYTIRKTTEEQAGSGRKVGFMTTGNIHTIEGNQWTTAIKANMVYLKARGEFETRTLNTNLKKGGTAGFNEDGFSPDKSIGGSASGNNYPTVNSGLLHVQFTDIGLGNPSADKINPKLLSDISLAAVRAGVTVEITTAINGHTSAPSRHNLGNAVDIARINKTAVSKDASIKPSVDKFVNELRSLGYNLNKEGSANPKAVLSFGYKDHDNHIHISNLLQS